MTETKPKAPRKPRAKKFVSVDIDPNHVKPKRKPRTALQRAIKAAGPQYRVRGPLARWLLAGTSQLAITMAHGIRPRRYAMNYTSRNRQIYFG